MPRRNTPSNPVKSIINSVESILPTGLTIIHIIVALVVGLVICSLLNDSTEGLSTGRCEVGSDTDNKKYKSRKECEATPSPGGTWTVIDDETDKSNKYELLTKATWDTKAVCYGSDKSKHAVLSKLTTAKACSQKGDGDWIKCADLKSLDSKEDRDKMILCGAGPKKGYEIIDYSGYNDTWIDGHNTRYDLTGSSTCKGEQCAPDNGVNLPSQNLASWMGCTGLDDTKVSCKNSSKPYFPKGLGALMVKEVTDCIDGWGKGNLKSLKNNGGGPIIAWGDASKSTYCKNTLFDVTCYESTTPRLLFDSEQCGDKCPCEPSEIEQYTPPSGGIDRITTMLSGLVGAGPACDANEGSGFCGWRDLTDTSQEVVVGAAQNITKQFRTATNTCG